MKKSRVQPARDRSYRRSRDVLSILSRTILRFVESLLNTRHQKKGRWEETRAATRSEVTLWVAYQQSRETSSCCRLPDRKVASSEHVSLVKQWESGHGMSVSFARRGPTSSSSPFVQQIKRLVSRGLSLHLSLSFLFFFFLDPSAFAFSWSVLIASSHSMMRPSLASFLSLLFFCLCLPFFLSPFDEDMSRRDFVPHLKFKLCSRMFLWLIMLKRLNAYKS